VPLPVKGPPDWSSTLRASDAPVIATRKSGVPVWVLLLTIIVCVAGGFGAGFFFALH
jgi:hypothetical protein